MMRKSYLNRTLKKLLAVLLAILMLPIGSLSVFAESESVRAVRDSQLGGERSSLFSYDWRFTLGDSKEYSECEFDDSGWKKLDLPHDFKITDRDPEKWLTDEIGWYRKTLYLPESERGKEVSLRFDGVQCRTTVYVNGEYAGYYPGGYSSFNIDITEFLNFGNFGNTIAVKVDWTRQDAWWVPGAGIQRDVWLTVTDKLCVNYVGTYIYTDGTSKATIETEIRNYYDIDKSATVKQTVLDRDGNAVATSKSATVTVRAGAVVTDTQELTVTNASLWELDSPYLYTMKTEIISDGKIADTYTGTFGFRTIKTDPDKGFFLNGKNIKLHGVCLHADLGVLGGAQNYAGVKARFEKLKKMGVNAIRTAHNQCDPMWVELCDEMGILLYDEGIVRWEESAYFNEFADQDLSLSPKATAIGELKWSEVELRNWIRRDRNHPSVVLWSFGNEVASSKTEAGYKVGQALYKQVESEDPQKNAYITVASNSMSGYALKLASDTLDAFGYNYPRADMLDQHHNAYGKPMIATETASAVASRGIYHTPADRPSPTHDDNQASAYGNSYVSWGKSPEQQYLIERDRPYLVGSFVWTGYDYLGEPQPYLNKNSYFGIIDTAGLEKDSYYFYQSVWTETPMVHLLPSFDDSVGETIEVYAYSNAASVELFFKAKGSESETSLGKQSVDMDTAEVLHYEWKVDYAEGSLIAKAYDAEGNITATDEIKSFGAPARVVLEADKSEITADGRDLVYVTASIVDEEGNFVATARNNVKFTVSGAGKLVGVDNGDSTDYDKYISTERKAFSGKVVAVIMSDGTEGDITIEAESYNISSATPLTIKAEHKAKLTKLTLGSIDGSGSITSDNGTLKLTTAIEPAEADYPRVKYSVDDPSVAYIDEYGVLKALGNGSVKVTVSALDGTGVSDSKTFTVSGQSEDVKVTGIALGGSDRISEKAGTLTLTASVTPTNASFKKINYSVTNGNAEIDETGKLTARYNGRVTVRASAADGSGVYAEKTIEISGQEANFTPVNKIKLEVVEGSKTLSAETPAATVKATLLPEGNGVAESDITWSIDGSNGKLVSNDKSGTVTVKALGGGEFTLTASVTNGGKYPQVYGNIVFDTNGIASVPKNPYAAIYARDFDTKSNGPTLVGQKTEDMFVSPLKNGDYLGFENVDFGIYGASELIITSGTKYGGTPLPANSKIELREGSPKGEIIKIIELSEAVSGDYKVTFPNIRGIHDIYAVTRINGEGSLYSIRFTECDFSSQTVLDPYKTVLATEYDLCVGETEPNGDSVLVKKGSALVYKYAAFGNDGAIALRFKATVETEVGVRLYDMSEDGRLLADFLIEPGIVDLTEKIPLVFGNHELYFVFDGEAVVESFEFLPASYPAFETIEAENCNTLVKDAVSEYGIKCEMNDKDGRSITVVRLAHNDSMSFDSIDFGDAGTSVIKLYASVLNEASQLRIAADGDEVYSGTFGKGDGFGLYELSLSKALVGKHSLDIAAMPGSDIAIDRFVFEADYGIHTENIFAKKLTLASDSAADSDPYYAVDTDISSAWTGSDKFPQSFRIDLGAKYRIGNILLRSASANAKYTYTIAVSSDASDLDSAIWDESETVFSAADSALGDIGLGLDGRFILITFLSGSEAPSIAEISGSGNTYNLAYNKPAYANHEVRTFAEGPNNQPATKANNDILYENNTHKDQWCANPSNVPDGGEWWVDLGDTYELEEFHIDFEYYAWSNRTYAFTLQGGYNGIDDWFDIGDYNVSGNEITVRTEFPVSARFIKVSKLKPGGNVWPNIMNFAAYESREANVGAITLDRIKLEMTAGDIEKLTATVTAQASDDTEVVWVSDNTAVARVDEFGNVTALADGSATICASAFDGKKSAKCTVTVGKGERVTPAALFKANELTCTVNSRGAYNYLGKYSDETSGQSYHHFEGTPETLTNDFTYIEATFDPAKFGDGFALTAYPYIKVGYRAVQKSSSAICRINPKPHYNGEDALMNGKRLWLRNSASDPALVENGSWQSFIYDISQVNGGDAGIKSIDGLSVFEANCQSYLNSMLLKPYGGDGYVMSAGDSFDLLYIAFFETERDAENYEFTDDRLTVTYMAGNEVFLTQTYKIGDKLKLPKLVPVSEAAEFIGWDTEDGIVLTTDITVSAEFNKAIVPTVLFTANDIQPAVTNDSDRYGIIKPLELSIDTDGNRYWHFAADPTKAERSLDNTRVITVFDPNKFPEGFTLDENRYVKLGYRAKLSNTNNGICDINVFPHTDGSPRLWTNQFAELPVQTLDGTWQSFVFDLGKIDGGNDGGSFKDTNENISDKYFNTYPDKLSFKIYGGNGYDIKADDCYDVLYAAFFDNAADAEAYDFTTRKISVTYMSDGVEFAKVYCKPGDLLTYPSETPETEGAEFKEWSLAEGTLIAYDTIVEAVFERKITPTVLFDADRITPKIHSGRADYGIVLPTSVSEDVAGNRYWHFVADPGKGYNSDGTLGAGYTGDNTRVYTVFDKDLFPDEFKLTDNRYVKIGYRGVLKNTENNKCNFNPMPYTDGRATRLWTNTAGNPVQTLDGTWQSFVFDLSMVTGGQNILSADGKSVFEANCQSYMSEIAMKIYGGDRLEISSGDYYDVLYVAFFDNLDDANDYEFAIKTANTTSLTLAACGGGSATVGETNIASGSSETFDELKGTTLTLTAVPDDGYKIDGWYNVTNGQNILLSRELMYTYTFESDTELEVRFYDEAVSILQKLVVNSGYPNVGYVTIDGLEVVGDGGYYSSRKKFELKAFVKDDYQSEYYPAYWMRKSDHVAFMGVGDTLEAYPLGNQIFYEPVYGKISENVKQPIYLYIDYANAIIDESTSETDKPEPPKRAGYDVGEWKLTTLGDDYVKVFMPEYTKSEFTGSSLTVNDKPVNAVYNSMVKLTAEGENFKCFMISIDDGEAEVLSYNNVYEYYNIIKGDVVITESEEYPSGVSAPVSFVKNIQATSSDDKLNFVAAHEVAKGYKLLERGVLMSDTLYDASVFKITHEGIIKGKIETPTDEATGIYMVSKGSLKSKSTWYGRAYMIVEDNTTKTVTVIYADDIISGTYPEA